MKDFKVITGDPYATVQIELAMLPSEKYRRNVVRGVLDLVGKERFRIVLNVTIMLYLLYLYSYICGFAVSTGGTCGLFLGVSILSFVELLYILIVRPFCDIYSQRDDDPWFRKFGNRKIEDSKFASKLDWRYHKTNNHDNDRQSKQRTEFVNR